MGEEQREGAEAAGAGVAGGDSRVVVDVGEPEAVPRKDDVDPAEFPSSEGVLMAAVDRDEFTLLPEYSHTIPTQSGPHGVKRWKAAIGGRWFLGRIVPRGEEFVLLPPILVMLVSPAEVAAQLAAFRDLFVKSFPATAARKEFGRILDEALAMVRASAHAAAVGREAVNRELEEERDAHGRTLDELSDAEAVLAAHGLMAEYATKRDARRALPEDQRPTNRVPPGIRRILVHALLHESAAPGSLLRKVYELVGLEAPVAEEGCRCDEIRRADPTRHFKGCDLREKYPEPAGPVAGVTVEIHQDFTGQDPDRVAEVFQAGVDSALATHRHGT